MAFNQSLTTIPRRPSRISQVNTSQLVPNGVCRIRVLSNERQLHEDGRYTPIFIEWLHSSGVATLARGDLASLTRQARPLSAESLHGVTVSGATSRQESAAPFPPVRPTDRHWPPLAAADRRRRWRIGPEFTLPNVAMVKVERLRGASSFLQQSSCSVCLIEAVTSYQLHQLGDNGAWTNSTVAKLPDSNLISSFLT